MNNGSYKEGTTEHVLVNNVVGLLVVGEGYRHRLHEALGICAYLMSRTIEIRKETITQVNVTDDVFELSIIIASAAKLPRFARSVGAMETKHWGETGELCPSGVKPTPCSIANTSVATD